MNLETYAIKDAKKYTLAGQFEPSEWECELYGMGRAYVLQPRKGQKIPNWFWRKMQFLILGNRWVKRK